MLKIHFSLLVLALNLSSVFPQWFTDCDMVGYVFTPLSYFRSKWYSATATYRYDTMSSCRYHAIAPAGYFIRATCTIQLDIQAGTTNCYSQRLYISRDGDKELRDAEFFCGTTTVTRDSIDNYMTLAYTSNFNLTGRFECSLQAIQITQANCDCGWNAAVRIFEIIDCWKFHKIF